MISPVLSEQERIWAKADKERRERLDKPCLHCVWARVEDDKIFCPIVIDCWRYKGVKWGARYNKGHQAADDRQADDE